MEVEHNLVVAWDQTHREGVAVAPGARATVSVERGHDQDRGDDQQVAGTGYKGAEEVVTVNRFGDNSALVHLADTLGEQKGLHRWVGEEEGADLYPPGPYARPG